MKKTQPHPIKFAVASKAVPHCLGHFDTEAQASEFMAQNLLAIPAQLTATREMHEHEKQALRVAYAKELEEQLPVYRDAHMDAVEHLKAAKRHEKQAKERVNAILNEVQYLADEVKEGLTDMVLSPNHTWEVIYKGQKHYFTYINQQIRLCKVLEVPDDQAADLISSSDKNQAFFAQSMDTQLQEG